MSADKTNRIGTCAKNEQVKCSPVLSEKDFYPPKDKRCLRSRVRDIEGGDNFAEYAEYYFDTYGEDS